MVEDLLRLALDPAAIVGAANKADLVELTLQLGHPVTAVVPIRVHNPSEPPRTGIELTVCVPRPWPEGRYPVPPELWLRGLHYRFFECVNETRFHYIRAPGS